MHAVSHLNNLEALPNKSVAELDVDQQLKIRKRVFLMSSLKSGGNSRKGNLLSLQNVVHSYSSYMCGAE